MPIDPAFRQLLGEIDLAQLDADESTIVGLWPDLRLAYMNRAWSTFAQQNGGAKLVGAWPIGKSIEPVLSVPVAAWYRGALMRPPTLRPAGFEYDCSSPTEQRLFRLLVYSLSGAGLLVVHSPVVVTPTRARYHGAGGMVMQCSQCRRVRVGDDPLHWETVPAWASKPPKQTSHGLCYLCFEIFFPA